MKISPIDDVLIIDVEITKRAKRITVLLGALDIKSKTEKRLTFNITRENIFQHPDYNPNTITHDITVIKLPEKVNYTGKFRKES